jgi:hypothetical protein
MFDNNVGLYFYSAVLQANTALIALAAVFVVFRFQILSQSLQKKDLEIIKVIEGWFTFKPASMPGELKSHFDNLDNIMPYIISLSKSDSFKKSTNEVLKILVDDIELGRLIEERKQIIDRQISLKSNFRRPMLSILCVIILSLCLLPFSYNLHMYYSNFELWIILSVIGLNIYALIINAIFVFRAIE